MYGYKSLFIQFKTISVQLYYLSRVRNIFKGESLVQIHKNKVHVPKEHLKNVHEMQSSQLHTQITSYCVKKENREQETGASSEIVSLLWI